MPLDKALVHLRDEDRDAALGLIGDRGAKGGEVLVGVVQEGDGTVWVTLTRQAGGADVASGVAVDMTPQEQTRLKLEKTQFRFRTLVESLPQNVFSADANGIHDFLNRRWFEFTGQPYGPVPTERWAEFIHPDDRERTVRDWEACLENGNRYDIEYRYLRYDGQYRWMHVMAVPELDENGKITRWFGAATDIHETKMMAVEREVITAELNHRIKNIFSVFGGLISLSARTDGGVVEFAEALQKRLTALAIAHDFLGVSPDNEAEAQERSLQSFLTVLARPYFEAAGDGRFLCIGEDVPITKPALTPIALIVHELLTNAVKYGALSSSEGKILIEMRREAACLRLDWRETWPDVREQGEQAQGFGSLMLVTVVERLLQGRLERHTGPTGFEMILWLPLDKLGSRGA